VHQHPRQRTGRAFGIAAALAAAALVCGSGLPALAAPAEAHAAVAATTALTAIHDLGVQLAVDDFGTGYSSLLYLRRFPVDALKLDRSFVAGVDDNPLDSTIVRSVIDLAHSLGLTSVAEGVETRGQLRALRAMDCDLAQGFYWSPGIPSAEVDELLAGDSLPPMTTGLGSTERTGSGVTSG